MNIRYRLSRQLVAMIAAFLCVAVAFANSIVQEWYVPQPEAQLRADYLVLAPNTNAVAESVIAITVAIPGTRIVYDHWEDGYEVDLNNPVQSSTRIWGDGNNANGIPPGYVNDPVAFGAGSVIILRNQVPLPRNAANVLFDGRDRLGSTNAIVMTRGGWFTTPGPLLANSVEVRAVPDWGTSFVLPVGEDTLFPTPLTNSMFEHCSGYIMAAQNGTVVTIDVDGPGAGGAITVTLNQGESYLINSGIRSGATVSSTKPIQVMEFYGDIAANYESRGANIPPLAKWSDDYYAPVGTATDGDETYVYLYNPDAAAITVNFTTRLTSGSFSIPAKSNYRFLMPTNSAARFKSNGSKPFWGVGLVGARPTANNVHDWGYSLVPRDFLSTEIVVGWGAGSRDGSQNGSPVWITATAATRLYVDYNGDRAGPNIDPKGQNYDVALDVTPFTVSRIFEPDRDQSGLRVYTLDGTRITGAWGQDPATAGPAEPFLDLGNTVPNLPVPLISKVSSIFTDVAPSGLSVNDVVEYTIVLDNQSLFSLSAVSLVDVLPVGVTYIAGSTTRDGVTVADSGSTAFPMDEGGLVVPILPSKSTSVIKYRVTINTGGTKVNTVSAVGYPGVEAKDTIVVPTGGTLACTLKLTNNAGTEVDYALGEGIYVTVTDPDANTNPTTLQTRVSTVSNPSTGDIEVISLTETAVNSGVFRNTSALPSSASAGLSQSDGTLNVQIGNSIIASHVDPLFGYSCPDTAIITAPALVKQLYLTTDGADSDTTGNLDRIDPVVTSDTITSQTAVLSAATPVTTTYSTAGTTNWTVPAGVTSLTVEAWGGGGAGGGSTNAGTATARGGAGGGGGAYASSTLNVTPGQNLTIVVPAAAAGVSGNAGNNGSPSFVGPDANAANALVRAAGGTGGTGNTSGGSPAGGAGGSVANSVGSTRTAGTNGGNGATGIGISSGAGGAGANPTGGSGGTAVGTQGNSSAGNPGNDPGGAGSGARTSQNSGSFVGGSGGLGRVRISYTSAASSSVTFTQTPSFAEAFSVTGTPSVSVYYTVTGGTMPATPNISAVLRKNGNAFATSTATNASGGLMTFSFPSISASFVQGDVISVEITTAQSGVSFRLDYDSVSKPSLVALPTNTVIHQDSLGVYDAPYPGGALVTATTIGQTLYVRAHAADPFGAYDITSMPMAIDGPGTAGDVSVTLGSSHVVATTTNGKTYEYVWSTGSTEGNFNIATTAKEGFENTISSSRSTTVNLSALDLGTPSTTEFTTGLNGPHTLVYAPDETIFVRVIDLDENTDPLVTETIIVTITGSGGDTEVVTLTETGPNSGIFVGGIAANSSVIGSSSNGTLYALQGSVPVVNYVDNDDATDTGSDTAIIPAAAPNVAVTKTLIAPSDGNIVIGETAQYLIRVTNNGSAILNTVQVVDTFTDSQLNYVIASPLPDTTSAGNLTWTNIGPLAAGQSRDIMVTFSGNSAANPSINTVNVTTGGGPTATANAPVIITRPAVSVLKTLVSPNPGPAAKGDTVVFNISVQNTGTTALQTVPLEDHFSDANFEFISASVPPDGVGAGSLLWNDVTGSGILGVNAAFSVNVTLKAKGAANPAMNLADVSFAEDVYGDPVPPSQSSAGVQTIAASISGTVFEDKGVAGFGGDIALPNVNVRLFSDPNGDGDPSDGVLVALTQSNSSGYYEFLNLDRGNYVVVQEDILGFISVADSVGANDNRVPVFVDALTSYLNNNFLDLYLDPTQYGTISGQVRNDTDADGDLADVDSGLAGAVITLFSDPNGDGNPADGVPIGIPITTTSTGNFTFAFVPPGNYVLVEKDPASFASTADTVNPNDNLIPVTVAAAGTVTGRDFLDTGNLGALGIIGNQIWSDVNNNGIIDAGEAGIDAVVVHLYQSTQTPGVESPYLITTSSSGGLYEFSNVPAGSYIIYLPLVNFTSGALINQPLSSTISAVVDDNVDHNNDGVQTGGSGFPVASSVMTLSAGETDNSKDFGFVPNSSLAALNGYLYVDSNGNGTREIYEFPIADVRVFVDQNNDGIWQSGEPFHLTDAEGFYSITGLPPGAATVVVQNTTLPSGVTQTGDPDAVLDHKTQVDLSVAQIFGDCNFGYQGNASIGDSIWNDMNGDGLQSATEPALANVLLFMDRNGNDSYDTNELFTISDDYGFYTFAGLIPGTYKVVIDSATVLAGLTQTGDPDGPTMDEKTTVVLNAGQVVDTADFGYQGNASISGIVWYDVNGNSSQDGGEPGLQNVSVYLDLNGDGIRDGNEPSLSTTALGGYSFTGLAADTYLVRVDPSTLPGGLAATFDKDGIVTLHRSTVVLPAATAVTDADFGYEGNATITGHLYIDSNGNGTQDSGEPDIAGVDVVVTDALGVVRTVTTDSAGDWAVTMVAGMAVADIDENDPQYPTGYVQTEGTDPTNVLAVEAATEHTDNDGFFLPASITGTVFHDMNRLTDDTVNGTGTNAGGIFINLVNPANNQVIASIPVNANGTFSFGAAQGVMVNSNYRLILSPAAVPMASELTSSSLPVPWYSMGENLGSGVGNDGAVDGMLSVSTTVGVLEFANFGITQAPDVTPVITAQPNIMNGPTDFNIRVQILELHNVDTEGFITFRIPKDARWSLREAYDSNLVTIDGLAVENNKWTHTETAAYHVFTTANPSIVVPSSGTSSIGLKARWNSQAQRGIYTLTVQIDSFSGREMPIKNNSDSDRIEFFQQEEAIPEAIPEE